MKRNVTRTSLSVSLTLVTDTTQEKESVCSLFGPVRAGLTTSQGTLGAQHTELLNYCLRSLEILQSKYYTDLDTSNTGMQIVRALHSTTAIDKDGIN